VVAVPFIFRWWPKTAEMQIKRDEFRDGVEHAFQSFDSQERYRHEASEDAWEKVLRFLQEKLK
jgi:dienelactone hydrolase